ncbi:hypothetical protein JH146_1345 [Methanocaldococcus bathoardescens]|uniref:Class III signal peptide-containing protein n=1 Tax=Methanocaldococcus bathoardescens TaxID=1301915 RepID=A0A076LH28_9EURY|nr:class III signal peptide-containing protein [Methanocaldococcus bathoardescens]AIJ06187.1 hypothetical protein JH146_1345 [Methanocaldococcus bathoardescens]
MKTVRKKLLPNRGQISIEFSILVTATVLVSIITAYFIIVSAKDLGYGVDESGEKAEKFINVTNNKSSHYIKLLNNSI